MPVSKTYEPEPIFTTLGEGFADSVEAANFPDHIVRYRNNAAAAEVGLDGLNDEEWISHFGKFQPLPDNLETPLAQRYHGHQFRSYNPEIGDGRGFLFAQMRDTSGRLMDLTTKGTGKTPYSRFGDGRLTMKGGVREIMATEMLEALGTNTSRTLSIIETGEKLYRNDEPSPARSCVMVRLTNSNIRIGTFQRHAYFSDTDKIAALTAYCLENYFDVTPKESAEENALTLLDLVLTRVCKQAADLMASGFVHGVLNTDNICITGEIFDFGPWRFLPHMDLKFTAAYFDESGLYTFGRQPDALHWNIYQLGGALADIADEDKIKDVLAAFPVRYFTALRSALLKRLGVAPLSDTEDDKLLKAVNDFMIATEMPYEQFFFDWYGGTQRGHDIRYENEIFIPFKDIIKNYAPSNPAKLDHAYFKSGTPCTMLIDEVEAIWDDIANDDNWQPLTNKIDAIRLMRDALNP